MHASYVENENSLYSNLITPPGLLLAESKCPYLYWTERHLQVMWWEQKYFKNIRTSQGLKIEVLTPGIWNSETGPDFLHARLKIEGQEIQGHIKIDLDDNQWAIHKHHQDSRYDSVILHISLWSQSKVPHLFNSKSEKIHQVYLEHFLTIPESRILQLIDLDQYPCRKFLGSGRVIQNHLNIYREEKILNLFQSPSESQLAQKAQYLKNHIDDTRLLLPAGIAMNLGNKRNKEAFFELFLRLLKYKDKPEDELLAIALGMCGFFTSKFKIKWRNSSLYTKLLKLHENLFNQIPYSINLVLNQIKPLNHPVRNIVFLVKLIRDPLLNSLFFEIYFTWRRQWPESFLKKDWSSFHQMILDRLPSYKDPYWNFHYTFENASQNQPISLLGNELKELTIHNTILPLLYVDVIQTNNSSEIKAFRDLHRFYSSFCSIKNK